MTRLDVNNVSIQVTRLIIVPSRRGRTVERPSRGCCIMDHRIVLPLMITHMSLLACVLGTKATCENHVEFQGKIRHSILIPASRTPAHPRLGLHTAHRHEEWTNKLETDAGTCKARARQLASLAFDTCQRSLCVILRSQRILFPAHTGECFT